MAATELKKQYDEQGYVIVPNLFSSDEVRRYRRHFLDLRAAGSYPGDAVADAPVSNDPLTRFARMINMHNWDAISRKWLLDDRLRSWLTLLAGREPYAAQTMVYFKPPGSRGQALHQDQFFLAVSPGTCIAAWLALDLCDEENGCLQVVPGSHRLPFLCPAEADPALSISQYTVNLPRSITPVPAIMGPGDVIFFHGHLIHGSFANTSSERFRCALIGHYIQAEAQKVAEYFKPLLRFDGAEVTLAVNEGGGPCGVLTDLDGALDVQMREDAVFAQTTE